MTPSAGVAPAMESNLRWIPVHEALTRALVWIPIFVLFTQVRFGLHGALRLAAFYYLFVVVMEVPSGWMSDRLGRVPTLRLAAVSWIVAQVCFLVGDDRFLVIMAGQFFLAGGFAALSGTDVAFHYDTLEALGQAEEYRHRRAVVAGIGYAATAVSALVGGLLGLIDLRLAFAASLALTLVQLAVALRLVEPPVVEGPLSGGAEPFFGQLRVSTAYLRNRRLGWIFFYGIILLTLIHVAYTLMQPWLTLLLGRTPEDFGATPLYAGVVFAAVSLVGAGAARLSAPLGARFGTTPTLIGFAALSAAIVTSMALWVHVAVLALVLFRSAQGAAAPVLISATVAPMVQQGHRATFLSLNSLAGRLGYGLILLFVADTPSASEVVGVLTWFSVTSWVMVAVLILTAIAVRDRSAVLRKSATSSEKGGSPPALRPS